MRSEFYGEYFHAERRQICGLVQDPARSGHGRGGGEVQLSGVCSGAMATCSGTAEQAPDMTFEATLIYSQDEVPAPDTRGAVVKLNAAKLPKGLDGRSRPRHPFAPGSLGSERNS